MPLAPVTLAFLAVLFLVLPWLASRTQRRANLVQIPRPALYLSASINQWILVLLLAGVLWAEGRPPASVGLIAVEPAQRLLLWAVGTAAVGLALGLVLWSIRRVLGLSESPLARHLIPRSGRERLLFALVVAPTAGIAEELLFRGFAVTRLAPVLPGGAWTAMVVTSTAFALGHLYQGRLGILRAGALGVVLAAPLVATRSVLPSIVAHTLLDVIGGVVLGRWMLDED